MRTFYFYSIPDSPIPSPYFFKLPALLAELSKRGIFDFKLWEGRHEAPVPIACNID